MKTEKAEIAMMHMEVKECQELPEARKGAWNTLFLRASRKNRPANTMISDFQPPEL